MKGAREGGIPESWTWAQLSELGSWAGGGTPSKQEPAYWSGGTVPWVSPKDMKSFEIHDSEDHITEEAISSSATIKLPPGTVLMVTRSGILKHTFPVAVSRVAVTLNQDLKALTPSGGVRPEFIAHALRCFSQQVIHRCSKDGTTVQSIETAELRRFRIPLAPVQEQSRIVEELDELLSDVDAGVAAVDEARAKLARYRAAVLKAAVQGALTAEWRQHHPATEPASELLNRILAERRRHWEEGQLRKYGAEGKDLPLSWKARYTEPDAVDDNRLPVLPRGWCWAAVAQCGEVKLGRQRAPQHHVGEHMRPYLRVANVYEDRIDTRDVKSMNFTPSEFETYALRYGDILLNEGQSPELVGRPAMYRDEVPGCCYQKTLLRFRSFVGIEPAFALAVFRSYLHSGRFRQSANITTSIAHLAAERFVVIEFPVPPQEEQRAIVEALEDQLSVVAHVEAELEAKLASAAALRQAILRHAFTGKLVPQDPTDEPASELLKRIAAEREILVEATGIPRGGGHTRRAAASRSTQ